MGQRMKGRSKAAYLCGIILTGICMTACGGAKTSVTTLTNVSYDPTREFYEAYNELFEAEYAAQTGEQIKVIQSHGGSGAQARSVVEGCNADVVTLALEHDISLIERTGLIDEGWIEELPEASAPYTSTIVFLVRAGNPKDIQDWDDLIRGDVEVITPDPKSSGGACWNFLAAWSYGREHYATQQEIQTFVQQLYENVSVMDSGARGATTTFVENGKGDVLLAWENEALTAMENYEGEFEIISPTVSILAQPSVAVVDDNVRANHTEDAAMQYLQLLYTDEAQQLAAEYGYRPSNEAILQEYAGTFDLDMKLYTIADYGGWDEVYEIFFDDEGIFDVIMGY